MSVCGGMKLQVISVWREGRGGETDHVVSPWDQGDRAILVFILINERVRIKRTWIKLLPSGIYKVVRMCFRPQFEESKSDSAIKKHWYLWKIFELISVAFAIVHKLHKMYRHLGETKKQWWWCNPWWIMNCIFTSSVCSLTVWCIFDTKLEITCEN